MKEGLQLNLVGFHLESLSSALVQSHGCTDLEAAPYCWAVTEMGDPTFFECWNWLLLLLVIIIIIFIIFFSYLDGDLHFQHKKQCPNSEPTFPSLDLHTHSTQFAARRVAVCFLFCGPVSHLYAYVNG